MPWTIITVVDRVVAGPTRAKLSSKCTYTRLTLGLSGVCIYQASKIFVRYKFERARSVAFAQGIPETPACSIRP